MPHAKGTVYLGMKSYIEKTFGNEGLARVLAALSPEDRDALRAVVPVGNYDIAPALHFQQAADRLLGKDDNSLCFEMGRFAAGWHLNSFHKLFLRFTNPHWLVDKGGDLWRHYHDSGRWTMEPKEPGRIRAHRHDFAVVDAGFCMNLQGWLTGAVELTGARDIKVIEPTCTARGGAECEIVITFVDK